MSVVFCEHCDNNIDTDFDSEHFDMHPAMFSDEYDHYEDFSECSKKSIKITIVPSEYKAVDILHWKSKNFDTTTFDGLKTISWLRGHHFVLTSWK